MKCIYNSTMPASNFSSYSDTQQFTVPPYRAICLRVSLSVLMSTSRYFFSLIYYYYIFNKNNLSGLKGLNRYENKT